MPKIKITESDKTGRIQSGAISNIVYIPIRFNKLNETEQITKTTAGIPEVFKKITLFTSKEEFTNAADTKVSGNKHNAEGEVVGETTPACIDSKSLSYKLCVHLLNIGYQILVEALDDESKPSWEELDDKNLYDIRFITLGAVEGKKETVTDGEREYAFDLTGEAQKAVKLAMRRGDCVALLHANEIAKTFDYSLTRLTGEPDKEVGVRKCFEDIAEGREYAAAFTPWFTTKHADFINTTKEIVIPNPEDANETITTEVEIPSADAKPVEIPASYGYLFAYANATKNNPEWYAIAGFERGIIPELYDVCHIYTSSEVEVLQGRGPAKELELADDDSDNEGFAINPICFVRPAGYILYGNRTLRKPTVNKRLTAQSFLNVRNGVSAIKKVMYEASRKYTFEQNTETLWINFQAYITPLLDRMQSGNGLLGYTFVKQKTDAKARLKAKLNVVPVEAVEDFDLEVVLTDDLNVSE